MAPQGVPTRSQSDTPSDAASLEPIYSPSFEKSAIILPSGVPTRDHSVILSDTPPL